VQKVPINTYVLSRIAALEICDLEARTSAPKQGVRASGRRFNPTKNESETNLKERLQKESKRIKSTRAFDFEGESGRPVVLGRPAVLGVLAATQVAHTAGRQGDAGQHQHPTFLRAHDVLPMLRYDNGRVGSGTPPQAASR